MKSLRALLPLAPFVALAAMRSLFAWLLCLLASTAWCKEAAPASDDPVIEAHMLRVTSELRCLVCQNQTIADSHAGLAEDLREEVRSMLRKGRTDQEIVDYMTARYGDFILYRPPMEPRTWLLWFGPAAMSIGGLAALVTLLRRRTRLANDQFEPDPDEATGAQRSGGRP